MEDGSVRRLVASVRYLMSDIRQYWHLIPILDQIGPISRFYQIFIYSLTHSLRMVH